MENKNWSVIFLMQIMLLVSSCHAQKEIKQSSQDTDQIAFPGAEGFGKYTTGGRGGKVIIVTNLDDNGAGSLRDAVSSSKAKIIVFEISGTIHLESPLSIKGNTTIAGQTAPGDGICLADHPVSLGGDNIIVRHLRFRMGDRFQNKGMVNGSGHDDAFGGYKRNNIIIDHCSMSWSTDEVFSVYGGDSVTLQWNIISEPLNYSYHFETGDKDFEHHGYGAIWGGKHLSAHHNLFAHCTSRNPRFNGTRNYPEEFVDYRNNVIYNWGQNNVYGGEGGNYNIVNNYYRPGPSTNKNVQSRIVNPSKQESPFIDFGKYYVAGNFVAGSDDVTKNNWLGIHMGNGTEQDKKNAVTDRPFSTIEINPQSAPAAYEEVLRFAGAILPARDTLDQRIILDVKNLKGRIIDVQGGYPHGTPYENTVNAWPTLRSATPLADKDRDGMPDDWETKNGLNPANNSDGTEKKLSNHFTNIEVYINSISLK